MKEKKINLYKLMTRLSVGITFGTLILIIAFVFVKGFPNLRPDLFSFHYTSENVSMMPSIITTVIIVFLTLLISVPVGILTAVYLVEYAKSGSKIVIMIRLATETLSGIPSIVYGLFGMILFVTMMGFKYSILSGSLTLSIMILPLIIRNTEESLKSVNNSIRMGSYALGAGKLRTIFRVVLPVAIPGILSGVVLATGRIVGETACLIFTLGTAAKMPTGLMSSSRSLALHMYMLSTEGKNRPQAYATALVLMLIVLILNYISSKIADRLMEGRK